MQISIKSHFRRRVRHLMLLMFLPISLFAFDMDSVLLRAEEYYRQNEFSKAIAEYKSLDASGYVSAELFYNLGNAYFKNHDIKSAILFYERAKRLAPNDETINGNLQHSRSFIFDRVEALPEHFLVVWGKAVRDLMTVRAWSWWSITCFCLTLAFCLLFLFVRKMGVRRFAFGLGNFCFILCLAAFSLGYAQKNNIERTDEAIVFAPSVTVKSSPDDSGNNLFILHEGIKIRIEDRIGEWCEIRIPDGKKGWIKMGDLEII